MDYRTAREIVAALRARQMSASELLEQTIRRIESGDGRINAVVVRDFDRARDAARRADGALASGDTRPLLGLPVTVKEAFNVAGLPTTWGIAGTEKIPVPQDAVIVSRLKAAGAVIIGKTNVPVMLADWQSANPIYGLTTNPWDHGKTPGGSSGGSAAALAAGYVSLEYGSDLAGSLRAPAHFCGIFSHKPSHGVAPMRGFAPPGTPALSVAPTVDLAVVGPMARSAGDLALALDVTAGPDESDATAYQLRLPPPRHAALSDYRVLVIEQHPLIPTQASIRSALSSLAEQLQRVGCKVDRTSALLPDLTTIATTFVELLMSFISADLPDEAFAGACAAAAALPRGANDFPTASARGLAFSHRDWIRADRRRVELAHRWRALFREWDVVLCPAMPTTAFAHDQVEMHERVLDVDGVAMPYDAQATWSSVATLTGNPATAMPIGLDGDALPIGMQIVGPSLEDRTTLAFADLVEHEFGGFVAPPVR
jgi:amidase